MNDGVHTLDVEKLSDYLTQQLDEFTGIKKSKKFNTGQSNPTYLLETAEKKYVLRKKPPGELLPSAHAVDREYRIIKALEETKVPVPRTVFLCNDESIIGTIFYVMEFVDGRIFWDPTLPEIDENKRMKVYEETVSVMAELHKIDVKKADLLDFGKPGNYFERQVGRWIKQYRAAETESYPEVETLIAWLEKTMPDDDGLISIVHGDYRLYNMIFDHEEESMLALLDWELSTIGHPYACLLYTSPSPRDS